MMGNEGPKNKNTVQFSIDNRTENSLLSAKLVGTGTAENWFHT